MKQQDPQASDSMIYPGEEIVKSSRVMNYDWDRMRGILPRWRNNPDARVWMESYSSHPMVVSNL